MSTSFNDYTDELNAQANAEADAGDDTRARLSSAFEAHYDDERRRVNTVPAQLAAARRARHLSQSQLSALAGIDQGAISRIERGQINASIETVSRLSESLGLHLSLVDDTGHPVSV